MYATWPSPRTVIVYTANRICSCCVRVVWYDGAIMMAKTQITLETEMQRRARRRAAKNTVRERHDRVEVRARDRTDRQDQRDERGAGGDGVLQELQSGVAR